MTQQPNELRERLLAALPQPENLATYREETAALLARHAKALRWDKITAHMLAILGIASVFAWNHGPWQPGTVALQALQGFTVFMFFLSTMYRMGFEIYSSQIATLKEIKQVQLQILELQASMQKNQPH